MPRVEQNPKHYLKHVPAQGTLFSCVYGQDRSPSVARRHQAEFLEGGLHRVQKLVRRLEDDGGQVLDAGTVLTRTAAQRQLRQIEAHVNTFQRVILLITPREAEHYRVAIALLESLRVPEFLIIYAVSVGELARLEG